MEDRVKHIQVSDRAKLLAEKALRLWGTDAQMFQVVGECGELIAAINRWSNQRRNGAASEVIAETADVCVMITQIMLIFSDESINLAFEKSLDKLEGKISEAEKR